MITVAVVGPDGAGKTTVARELERTLPLPAVYVYMGVSPESSNRVLPTTRLVRWLRRKRPPSVGAERSFGARPRPRGALGRAKASLRAAARTANRIAEECYRAGLAAWHRGRGRVVIFDRHVFADFYTTDVGGGAAQPLSRRLHGAFLRYVLPAPDLVVYLDAPAEVLRARKAETSLETLEAMRANYARLAAAGLRFARVDATRPLAAVVAEVSDLVSHYARHRRLPEPQASHAR